MLKIPDLSGLLPLILLSLLLSACSHSGVAAPERGHGQEQKQEQASFRRFAITVQSRQRQTVIPGHFFSPAHTPDTSPDSVPATAQIALLQAADKPVVTDTATKQFILQFYRFDGWQWQAVYRKPLTLSAAFVDVARIQGQDRLLLWQEGELYWLEPISGEVKPLLEPAHALQIALPATQPQPQTEPEPEPEPDTVPAQLDISHDLNGDGLDDLLLPGVKGFQIALQQADGRFTSPRLLAVAEPFADEIPLGEQQSYAAGGLTPLTLQWYLSRVHMTDINLDGRQDLALWHQAQSHFSVWYQLPDGRFSETPAALEPMLASADSARFPITIHSEGYAVAFENGGEEISLLRQLLGLQARRERTVLRALKDLNGDGMPDLLLHALRGRSLTRQQSEFIFYPGISSNSELMFGAGLTLRASGKAAALAPWGYSKLQFIDLDGNATQELIAIDVRVGPGGMLRAMAASSIALDLELFALPSPDAGPEAGSATQPDPDRQPGSAAWRHRVRPELFGGRGPFFPPVLLGDVTGDGHADLLTGQNWHQLLIYPGLPAPDWFGSEPQRIGLPMPEDERHLRLLDLNQDGRADLLLSLAAETAPQKIIILLAQ